MLRNLFLDPLTIKELSGVSRRWQTYVGRMVYVGLMGLIVFIFWEQVDRRAAFMSPSAYAELGRELFAMFVGLQLVCVTLSGVSGGSDQVIREVRAGTLGLLGLTPLTPWRIAAGKWKAAMAQAFTIILCGAPVVGICVYLGGVTAYDALWSFTLSIAAAAMGAGVSLLFSSIFRAGYTAIIVSICALFLYCLLPILALMGARGDDDLITMLCYVHPAFAAGGSMSALFGAAGRPWSNGWPYATLSVAVQVLIMLRLAALRIEVLLKKTPEPSLLSKTFDAMDRFYEDLNPKALKNVRLFAGKEGVWQSHAILWKELKTRASGKLRNATRIGLGLLLFILLPLSCMMSSGVGWAVPMLWLTGILFVFMAMANGVALFVKEKEERKWDILLSTPLGAWEIIRAKLLAGLVALAPLAIILLFFWTLLAWAYQVGFLGWLMTIAVIGLFTGFAYVLAAAASLRANSLRAAFSITFGVVLFVLAILPLILTLLKEFSTSGGSMADSSRTIIHLSNPAPYLEPFSESGIRWGSRQVLREAYEALLGYFIAYTCIYSTAIALLIVRMVFAFDRVTGRSRD